MNLPRLCVLSVSEYELLLEDTPNDERIIQIQELIMGDSYKALQVGAMGPGARADLVKFSGIWESARDDLPLAQLAAELGRILAEMHDSEDKGAPLPFRMILALPTVPAV